VGHLPWQRRATEQVAHRLPPERYSSTAPLMLRPVVDHVAALAEGREVGVRALGRVVVPAICCQDDMGPVSTAEDISPRPSPDPAAPSIAPAADLSVPPTPIPRR
jgi:hypothetical protein